MSFRAAWNILGSWIALMAVALSACAWCDPHHEPRNHITHIDRDLSGVVIVDYCGPAPKVPTIGALAKHSGPTVVISTGNYLAMTRALDDFDVWADCVEHLAPIEGI